MLRLISAQWRAASSLSSPHLLRRLTQHAPMDPPSPTASSSRDKLDDTGADTQVNLERAISAAAAREPTPCATDLDERESCLICLGDIVDRCVLPRCFHSLFCFDCIIRWIGIHRRCPLCSASIDGYIIHSIRSDHDYIRHYLPSHTDAKGADDTRIDPLRLQVDLSQSQARLVRRQLQQRVVDGTTATEASRLAARGTLRRPTISSSTRPAVWGESRVEERQRDAILNWDQRLAFRRRVYREQLYCLHVGSNAYSQLGPPPTHTAIASSKPLESTLMSFIRRELLAFPLTNDVDFLSRYSINVLKTFDAKSSSAIDLIAEFLGYEGAQQFCHEVYTFSRFVGDGSSPTTAGARQRDKVKAFDSWAKYEVCTTRPPKRRNGEEHRGESSAGVGISEDIGECDVLSVRAEVSQGREKLLRRLEGELHLGQSNELGSNPIAVKQGLKRERELREKLVRKKHEGRLKQQAADGRDAIA